MTKRLMALFLMLAMLLTMLVACQPGGKDEGTEADTEVTDAPTDPAQPTEADTDPAQPTDTPTEPTEPTETPTEASEPTQPTEPTQPEEPTQPTEPEVTEPADGIYDVEADKACFVKLSFDECEAWAGETELCKFFAPGNAAAMPEVNEVPAEATAIRIWGWLAATQEFKAIGYKIDDGKAVFADEWMVEADDAVKGAAAGMGGDYATRFRIWPDVSTLTSGAHTVKALYKLADDTIVCFQTVKINVGYRKAVLGDISRTLTSDVASQTAFDSSDLSSFFTMELPINESEIANGLYTLAGIVDFKTAVDGQYSMLVKDFWTQNANGSYMVVRGISAVKSDDVGGPGTELEVNGSTYTFYPIANYYETDGNPEDNSCGGAGICIAFLEDGRLVVTVKCFDPNWPSRVGNARFTYTTDNTSRDILVTDDNDTVNIYVGRKLIVSIALEGANAPEDYSGLIVFDNVHFAKKATLTGFDGTVNTVENTLVVDSAASEIGMAARAATVRFSGIEIKELSKTAIPGMPTYLATPEFMMEQVNAGGATKVSNTDAVMGDGFITMTSNGGDPYVAVIDMGANINTGRYAAIKYRTSAGDKGEFFIGSEGGWHGATDEIVFTYTNDGEWHLLVVDLTASASFTNVNNAAYCRFDYFLGNGGAIDVAYVGFFETEEDAQSYYAKTMPAGTPAVDWNNVKLQETLTISADELGIAASSRGAAFSPDGKYFFDGVLNAGPNNVTMIDMATGKKVAYLTFEGEAYAKGLAVDDRGYLYVGLANRFSVDDVYIEIYKIDYEALTLTRVSRLCICEEAGKSMRVNGLSVAQVGDKYIAYLFSDKLNVLFKLDVTDAAAPAVTASIAMDESFYMDIYEGNAIIATKGDKVSVVNENGVINEYTVANAYAVGMYDKYALVAPKNQGDFVLTVLDITTGEAVGTVTADTDLSAGSQFVYVKVIGDTLFVVVQNDRILSAKLF